MSRAHRITTPSLIIHSEADYRCPIEQGEQLFAVMVAALGTGLLVVGSRSVPTVQRRVCPASYAATSPSTILALTRYPV